MTTYHELEAIYRFVKINTHKHNYLTIYHLYNYPTTYYDLEIIWGSANYIIDNNTLWKYCVQLKSANSEEMNTARLF